MLDLETALGDALLRGEPDVPLAASTVRALAALEPRSDLSLEVLRRHAFADPALALELLAAANAVWGTPPVLSLPGAEARLGEAEVVRVVRAAGRRADLRAEGPLAAPRQRAWRGALVSAMLCRELARERGIDPEEAYACGLLHDVGRLAALATIERLAAGTRAAPGAPVRRWEVLAERWHVALGATVAKRLALPRPLFEAIAFHHPGQTRSASPAPLLRVVRSVDALVAVLLDGADSGPAVDGAGLTPAEASRLARAVERMLEHVASLEREPSAPGPASAPGAPLAALREAKGQGVRLRLAGREYAAVGFARHQLLVAGPAPLGEGALLEVEVLDRRRAPFHARVLTVWAEGSRFGAILLPLGLSGPSLAELGGSLPAGADA
jgi:putative nucleotidyltransferase with HDIG domain